MREVGAVKLTNSINGNQFVTWILIGKLMVERLDGLWRRQIHSTSGQNAEALDVHLEVAHLAIPPSMLSDYVKSGTDIDLEIAASDSLTLIVSGQPWMPARMCNVEGKLGIEMLSGAAPGGSLSAGTTRLSIEFGSLSFDSALATEMSQVGALYDTGIELSDIVYMVVNKEKVGEAHLRTYQGRYAISVL